MKYAKQTAFNLSCHCGVSANFNRRFDNGKLAWQIPAFALGNCGPFLRYQLLVCKGHLLSVQCPYFGEMRTSWTLSDDER